MLISPITGKNYIPFGRNNTTTIDKNKNKKKQDINSEHIYAVKYYPPNAYTVIKYGVVPIGPNTTLKRNLNSIFTKNQQGENPIILNFNSDVLEKIENKLNQTPKRGLVIGITGKSAAGKSTLTEKFVNLAKQKGVDITVVNGDSYFKDTQKLVKEAGSFDKLIQNGFEFDAPSNFRLDLLKKHLNMLSEGKEIKTPHYVGNGTGISNLNVHPISPARVIILEGLPSMYPKVKDALDVKVYIDTNNENERLRRYKERAPFRHPEQTEADILNQYTSTTKAADKYIAPHKGEADIVLNSGVPLNELEEFFDKLTDTIAKSKKSNL